MTSLTIRSICVCLDEKFASRIQNITQMDISRRETQKELSAYINCLQKSSKQSQNHDKKLEQDKENYENINIEGGVEFPSNFDEVVECMSRHDLISRETECDKNESYWPHQMLLDGVTKTCCFKDYDDDSKIFQEKEKIAKELSKIKMYDRKIAFKEDMQVTNQAKYEEDISKLNGEIEAIILDEQSSTDLSSSSEDQNNFNNECRRSTNSKQANGKFFITEAFRSIASSSSEAGSLSSTNFETEVSRKKTLQNGSCKSNAGGDMSLESNQERKKISSKICNIIRNKEMAGRCSMFTSEEENRLTNLLRSIDDHGDIPILDSYGTEENKEKMRDVDKRLKLLNVHEFNILQNVLAECNINKTTIQNSRDDALYTMAKEREDHKKLKEIDDALKALSQAPISVTKVENDSNDCSSMQRSINHSLEEGKRELEESGVGLKSREEIRLLICSLS